MQGQVLFGGVYITPENFVFYSKIDETNSIRLENVLNDIVGQYGEMLIFLTGDFNSRTASEPDFIKDDYLVGLAGNFYMGDSFDIERKSKDKTVNNYGISLIYVQIV